MKKLKSICYEQNVTQNNKHLNSFKKHIALNKIINTASYYGVQIIIFIMQGILPEIEYLELPIVHVFENYYHTFLYENGQLWFALAILARYQPKMSVRWTPVAHFSFQNVNDPTPFKFMFEQQSLFGKTNVDVSPPHSAGGSKKVTILDPG